MKTLLIALPAFLVLNACSTKEDDTAAADDSFADAGGGDEDGGDDDGGGDDGGGDDGGGSGGDTMSDAPGCEIAGALCMAYTGALWSGQEEMQCSSYSDQSEAAGGPPFTYAASGCAAGATALCDGFLAGVDADNNLLDGTEMVLYFYSGLQASQAQDLCNQYGGNYSTL